MSEDAVDIEIETPDDEENASGPDEETGSPEDHGDEQSPDGQGDERSLVARVAAHDEGLAAEVAQLREEAEEDVAEAEARVEELESKLKRTQADFQNYKKRAKKRQEDIKERATEDLVERLVPVRDNLLRALEQDENADIRDGVESTLEEFDRVLAEEDVEVVEPEPGDEVDPERHQVMMRVDSDQPAETIAEVYRVGYEMADKVIQEAQVTVSEGEE